MDRSVARDEIARSTLSVMRFLIAPFALVGCIGYGEFISPAEAQRIEKAQCERKPDADERRSCLTMVGRKYQRYNSEGGYPDPTLSAPHPVR